MNAIPSPEGIKQPKTSWHAVLINQSQPQSVTELFEIVFLIEEACLS